MATAERTERWIRATAEALEQTGWAAEVVDADWRLAWTSTQLGLLLGEPDPERLGVGEHLLVSRTRPVWRRTIPPAAAREWARINVPIIAADAPCGVDGLRELLPPEMAGTLDGVTPRPLSVWTSTVETAELGPVRYFGARARERDGTPAGTVYIYGSTLPAGLLALVARGDRGMFERMARLVEPGRREAAILFADVQASGRLSRHLASAAYFALIRDLTTAIDAEVVERQGIVGKHAGDGVTAFFLAADLGSPSAAARAAIETALALQRVTVEVAERHDVVSNPELVLNAGLNWGSTLYMGQVTTGGRLEVTALGDEVNDTARIQETACDGQVLVTKRLVERLGPEDAAALDLDPDRVAYRELGELPSASEKALRDSGRLAVTSLGGEDLRPGLSL